MSEPVNLSFEVAGPMPTQADRWNHVLRSASRLVAGWATNDFPPLSRPNEINHGDWTPVNANVTADVGTAPDGTATADELRDDATNGLHYVRRTAAISFENGESYTFGFFAQAVTLTTVGAYLDLGSGDYAYTCFDVSAAGSSSGRSQAAHVSGPGLGVAKVHASITRVNDDWFLCSTSFSVVGSQSLEPAIILNPNATPPLTAYVGSVSLINVWGAFLCQGALAPAEGFELAWDNDGFSFTLQGAVPFSLATFGSPPSTKEEEDFEELWGNSPYRTELFLPTAATFDASPEPHEDFEEGWDNDDYQTALTAPVAATFDPSLVEPFEPFEDYWDNGLAKDAPVTATPATDVLNLVNHRLYEGQRVKLTTSGTLPGPLQPEVEYFVVDAAADPDAFKLSESSGGSAIDITDAGVGSHALRWKQPTPGLTFTANPTTDELTLVFGHGVQNGQLVVLGSTIALPTPLTMDPYYVVGATATAIQVSTSHGGAPVNIIDAGSGVHYLTLGIATWGGATSGAFTEDFEVLVRDRTYVADPGTDTLTSAAHGLANGTVVFVVPPQGGSLPGGLNPTVPYFVVGAAASTFQLSLTAGGPAVDVTSSGVGVQRVRGDPARYWNELGFNATL